MIVKIIGEVGSGMTYNLIYMQFLFQKSLKGIKLFTHNELLKKAKELD